MYEILLIIFLFITISLIVIIMLQQGKGINIETSFRTGSFGTFFSSSNSVNSMTRVTVILAVLFFIFSLILDNISSKKTCVQKEQEKINRILVKKDNNYRLNKLYNDIPQ